MPYFTRVTRGTPLNPQQLNQSLDAHDRHQIRKGPGIEIRRCQAGTVISATSRPTDDSFWARITGSLEDGEGNNRWFYSWQEVVKTAPGYGLDKWEDGPRFGTTEEAYALNTTEMMNSNEGVQGTGIDADGLPGTFEHKPVPAGVIVRMYPNPATGEYLFTLTIHIDGSCAR